MIIAYKRADWIGLCSRLADYDWNFTGQNCSDAMATFSSIILDESRNFIPMRDMVLHKRIHPWINDRCKRAIHDRDAAVGTDAYKDAIVSCSQIMASERNKWIQLIRKQILALPK